MKRILILCLALILLVSLCACRKPEEQPEPEPKPQTTESPEPAQEPEPEPPAREIPEIKLPEDSAAFSGALAQQALVLCTGHSQERTSQILEDYGFEILEQRHYDKDPEDPAHTSAFTIGKRQVRYEGSERELVLVVIRGTDGAGEWVSNFNVMPSRDFESPVAENFDLCAQDIETVLSPYLEGEPLVLVAGHSRGAACANLLGVRLQEQVPEQNLFVYTFATPTTLSAKAELPECRNIFNLINPNDLVTLVPLQGWGFHRAGTDILLPGDDALSAQLQGASMVLLSISPSLESYYNDRHSLTGPGLDEENGIKMPILLASLLTEPETFQALSRTLSPESDLAPLLGLVSQMGSDSSLLQQHMPATYQLRLTVLTAQKLTEE